MKSVRVNGIRIVCTLLVAGLALKAGCSGNDFLGLEDYQRDLLGFGLLASGLLNPPPATDAGGGGEEAEQVLPTIKDGWMLYIEAKCGACHCPDASGGCAEDAPSIVDTELTVLTEVTRGDDIHTATELTELEIELIQIWLRTHKEGPPGPPGPQGQAGADGQDGAPGPAGADGQDGAPGPPGADGQDGANGTNGRDGTNGTDGQDGLPGPPGPAGGTYFDIFIDDFFTASDVDSYPVYGELPVLQLPPPHKYCSLTGVPCTVDADCPSPAERCVTVVTIEEPAIGVHTVSGTAAPVAFRVAIPQNYDAGYDITMRLFLHRTGEWNEGCQVMTVDAARLRPGSDVETYGTRLWIKTAEYSGTPADGWYLVVDLPINTAAGLNYPNDLQISEFVAFEFATYGTIEQVLFPPYEVPWYAHDGGLYHLLGVEFFESDPGTAALVGAEITNVAPGLNACDPW
jgi:hypothetical protein